MSFALTALLLTLPWLNPLRMGPSPATYTFLFAWSSGIVAMAIAWGRVERVRGASLATETRVAFFLAATISCLVALIQYFNYAAYFSPWITPAHAGDAFGNLRQRNQFATLTSMGLLALLSLAATSAAEGSKSGDFGAKRGVWMGGVGLCLFLLAFGNAASGSRTGLLQWVLVLGLMVLWSSAHKRQAVAVSVIALATYAFAAFVLPIALDTMAGVKMGGILARFAENPGCASRTVLWSNVLHLIAQKPWLGWGWGELDYAHFMALYPGERFCDILDNAHNLPLHLAVELGVPIAVGLCGSFVWWVVRNKPWVEPDPMRQLAWGVLAVIGLHSLLEYPLWYGPFQIAVVLCWALLDQKSADAAGSKRLFPQTLWAFIATLSTAFCLYAGWDYWRISQLYLAPEARAAAYRDDTYNKVKNTWLFQNQVQFADLTTQTLDQGNATARNTQAKVLLHFSPEPRVVEAIIESAVMLGDDSEALYYLQRYKAAFPREHAVWAATSARYKAP